MGVEMLIRVASGLAGQRSAKGSTGCRRHGIRRVGGSRAVFLRAVVEHKVLGEAGTERLSW